MPQGLPPIGAEVMDASALPPIGADVSAPPPTFTASNQKDAQGNATVDPNTLGTYVRHLWNGVNPVAIGQLLPFPKALGGSGLDHPLNPVNIVKGLHAVKQEADAALNKGDYVTALAKYVESVIPVLGPIMSHQGNELVQGKYAAAAGDMTGLAVNAALPHAVGELNVRVPTGLGLTPANPAEAAAVQFGQARDIPIDAATATGNRFVRGVQALTEHSPIGSVVAERGRAAQQAGLTRVGGELAAEAHPVPVTPEQAGAAVRTALADQVRRTNTEASAAYDTLRQIEAHPARAESMHIDLQASRAALRPIYVRLRREAELVPLQGDKARALTALDRLMNGTEGTVPLSIVDEALGDLKSMARTDVPELRTQGQGIAAQAVRHLEQQVQATAQRAGPDAVRALQQGRAATVEKYQLADVLGDVAGADAAAEPVKIMRKLTAPKDSAIELLRRVQTATPQQVPQIARAYLEDALSHATAEGGFGHTAKLAADWENLGTQTKRVLFPGTQTPALDRFFLLAKKMAESPNPSGTALTLASGSHLGLVFTNPITGIPLTLGSGAIAALLRSPRGVQALTRATQLSVSGAQASGPARTAALLNLVTAARDAGVLDVPKAADQQPSGARP